MNPVQQTGASVVPDRGGAAEEQPMAARLSQRVQSLRLPQHASGSAIGGWVAWTLCILFAGSTAALGWMLATRQPADAGSAGTGLASGEQAEATPAAEMKAPGQTALLAKGYIVAKHQVLVSPQVSGRLVMSEIEEGMTVKKGELLAELEDTEYKADYERAEAAVEGARERLRELHNFRPEEIAQAHAELAEAQAQLEQLKLARDRSAVLVEQKMVSKESNEETEFRYLAMKKRVDKLTNAVAIMDKGPREEKRLAAAADLRQAEAEFAKAKWRWDRCKIYAPISGTILKKNAEVGNVVNPIAFNGSYSLCDLADLSELEVELPIQERDIAGVFEHQKCKIQAEAYPKRDYDGRVSRIMPIADRAKGAVSVRVEIDVPREEQGLYLRPEMGAVVTFLREKAAGKEVRQRVLRRPDSTSDSKP